MRIKCDTVFGNATVLAILSLVGLPLYADVQGTNTSFQAIQAAADTGDRKAQYELAGYYTRGIGPAHELPKAIQLSKAGEYLRKAAEQGYAPAEIALGSWYGRGWGVPRNIVTAVQWYRKAAEQGDALAQYAMGNFYAEGRGVTNDMVQAIDWWRKAVVQNQADAEAALGQLYLLPSEEHGTNYLNSPEGFRFSRLAANQGSAMAMNNLGVAFENGIGIRADVLEAARWYVAAAEQGNAAAQGNLGQLYFDGRGVSLDLVQAYKWFKLSANQGNTIGIVGFRNYQSHTLLKPDQLAAAEQMVQDFKPQPFKKSP
jgi:TPR repeat protein